MHKDTIIWKIAVPVLCIVAGIFAGYQIRDARVRERGTYYEMREGGYRFINPLLECEGERDLMRNEELRPFRNKVETYVRDRMRYPGVERVSIYFRELNDGIWFSIGDTERFAPASLRKVPMLITLLKQAERTPGLLNRKVRFDLESDHTLPQTIKPAQTLSPGKEYSITELLRRMIVYSDNNAFFQLSKAVDPEEFARTYDMLAMRAPDAAGPEDFLSVQTYASFFRVLFNATYLDKPSSEQALSLLAQVDFKSGIVAGVPADLLVAHKFGEHRDLDGTNVQLHDCGIVYYPQHPYLLCIMTRGTSLEYLDDAIATISKVVYEEVNAQHNHHE
jgi:beta-lactamase class A